jgi:hypothetical protein
VQNRRQFFAASYYVIWAVLLAVFVGIGAREVWIGSRGVFISGGPFSSTDAFLKALLEVPNGSERCAGIMRELSASQAIYFCPRRDPKGNFVYGLLAYLSPPRQMRMVEIDGAELEQKIASVDRRSTSALIFFGLQPPSEFKGWRVGANLFIVPLESSK